MLPKHTSRTKQTLFVLFHDSVTMLPNVVFVHPLYLTYMHQVLVIILWDFFSVFVIYLAQCENVMPKGLVTTIREKFTANVLCLSQQYKWLPQKSIT